MSDTLCVEQLNLTLNQVNLLSNVSFNVNAGELVSIIGPNGAGKSSLLRAISGDISLSSGAVLFNQKPLQDWSGQQRAQHMAVLTQANTLSFAFTVCEVVVLGRTPHKSGYALDSTICNEAMAALDVLHLSERLYPSLSGGEKQRVQLARVLVQIWQEDSEYKRLLLLDEPTTSLDLGHERQLLQVVRSFADKGVAVIMVAHDVTLASAYSDRLIVLQGGRLIAQGTPEEVVTESQMNALFSTCVSVLPHPKTGKPVVVNQ